MIKNAIISKTLLLLILTIVFSSCSEGYVRKYGSRKTVRNSNSSSTFVKKASKSSTISLTRSVIVSEAKKYLGVPYKYGGKTPRQGFDCSGFSTFVYSKAGVPLSGSSSQLSKKGKKISLREIKPGDLAFFGSGGRVTHVGIVENYSSDSFLVLHSTSSKGVRTDDVKKSKYWREKYLFSRSFLN